MEGCAVIEDLEQLFDLTEAQQDALAVLRAAGMHWGAEAVEDAWRAGQRAPVYGLEVGARLALAAGNRDAGKGAVLE